MSTGPNLNTLAEHPGPVPSAGDPTPSATTYERTIRVALVLNGGVSLAVWMGGVTHELNRLITRPGTEPTSDAWRKILGLAAHGATAAQWGRQRVIVDFVSGTSAGGLNGSVLAASLATGRDLPPLKEMWREKAGLSRSALLKRRLTEADCVADSGVNRTADGRRGQSVLNGAFFHSQIEHLLIDQPVRTDGTPRPVGPKSLVTLLVTATALDGGVMKVEDSQHHAVGVTDHRRVYEFRRQPGCSGAFDDDFADLRTLALAARASASFPGAFTPIQESKLLARRKVSTAKVVATDPVWLMDGGVLDNAPFEPLLDALDRTPRAERGDRWIVHVVPSTPPRESPPEGSSPDGSRPDGSPPADLATPPTHDTPPSPVETLDVVSGSRGEVNLRHAVESLRAARSAARASHVAPEELIGRDPFGGQAVPGSMFTDYRRTRAAGFVQYLQEITSPVEKFRPDAVPTEVVDAVLAAKPHYIPRTMEPHCNGTWQWGITVAIRLTQWMTRNIRNTSDDDDAAAPVAAVERELRCIRREVTALYAGVDAKASPQQVIADTREAMANLMVPVDGFLRTAVRAWAAVGLGPGRVVTAADLDEAWSRLLKVEVLTNFAEWHARATPPPFDLVLVDPGAYAATRLLAEGDAQWNANINSAPDLKLYGTRVGHFGAFIDSRYRDHDWTWGRIDAAMCLASAILPAADDDPSLQALRDSLRRELMVEILAEEGIADPATSFRAFREATDAAFTASGPRLLRHALTAGQVNVARLLWRTAAFSGSYLWDKL